MIRPSENEIWQVLEGKDVKASKKVAVWLSTDEGLNWIIENTERIMKYCEDAQEDMDIPSEQILEAIHRHINEMKRRRKMRRRAMVAAVVAVPVLLITALWVNVNSKMGNVLFDNPENVSEFAALGERKLLCSRMVRKYISMQGRDFTILRSGESPTGMSSSKVRDFSKSIRIRSVRL